jgi:hypothetical protein
VTPVTPQVTPHTLTPVTPGTFTPIAGGAGAAPQWTIGPITLGGQQSWPVSAHTITGGWSGPVTQLTQQVSPATLQLTQHLTPVFGAAGGGGAAPQWTIHPVDTPGATRWTQTLPPTHSMTLCWPPPTFPFTLMSGTQMPPSAAGTPGGAAPQWTIGAFTLGGQQSWPVSAHTITGGWSGPVTQLTQQVTPALTPVFGAAAGGGGAAPQWTIGPITLGGQQSWPVSAHTITGGWSSPVTPIASHVTPVLTPVL